MQVNAAKPVLGGFNATFGAGAASPSAFNAAAGFGGTAQFSSVPKAFTTSATGEHLVANIDEGVSWARTSHNYFNDYPSLFFFYTHTLAFPMLPQIITSTECLSDPTYLI